MRTIDIELKVFAKKGETCLRCNGTKSNLLKVVDDLQSELEKKNIKVKLTQTILPKNKVRESNSILINGTPIEEIVPRVSADFNECCSCGALCGEPTDCKTLLKNGDSYDEVPGDMIRDALLTVVNGKGENQ